MYQGKKRSGEKIVTDHEAGMQPGSTGYCSAGDCANLDDEVIQRSVTSEVNLLWIPECTFLKADDSPPCGNYETRGITLSES